MDVTLSALQIADEPQAWRDAGFAVDGTDVAAGAVVLQLVGREAGRGIVGWSLTGLPAGVTDIDGIALVDPAAAAVAASRHANGVSHIDHVVVRTPDLERTNQALEALGVEARRQRDAEMFGQAVRQVFYRLGETILEVVGSPGENGEGPARIWGVTFTVDDIDATAARLGDAVGRVREAVQPGRRITTLRGRDLGVSTAVAFISPHVRRAAG